MHSLIALGSTAAFLYGIFAVYKIGWGLGRGDIDTAHKFFMDLSYKQSAVQEFKHMGLEVILFTGDNAATARAIGNAVGVVTVIAEVLPEDKEKEVRRLQSEGKKVYGRG